MRQFFILVLLLISLLSFSQQQRYADVFREFHVEDSLQKSKPGSILFIGSSSFRMWRNVHEAFPDKQIINRGFGGSTLEEVIQYAGKLIFPYKPKQVVIYAGENDIAANVPAEEVCKRFETLHKLIRKEDRKVPIAFISIKPSPSREKFLPEVHKANRMIKDFISKKKNTVFIDVVPLMLNADGSFKEELFLKDRLHMNQKGYDFWIQAIAPHLIN